MAGAKLLDQYCLDHSVKVAVTIGHRLVEPSRETVGYLPEGDPLPLPGQSYQFPDIDSRQLTCHGKTSFPSPPSSIMPMVSERGQGPVHRLRDPPGVRSHDPIRQSDPLSKSPGLTLLLPARRHSLVAHRLKFAAKGLSVTPNQAVEIGQV